MIASWIAKRMVMSMVNKWNEDNVDLDKFAARLHDDIVYNAGSELGIGETIKGKKAWIDWNRRWLEKFPKRKFSVKSICFSSWPLNLLNNVVMVRWTLTQTDKQNRTFRYDGATFMHMKNFKIIHAGEYISMVGLPKTEDLIEPLAED